MPSDTSAPATPVTSAPGGPTAVSQIDASRPEEPWLPLTDYGLIGNERTGALVSRHGSIDWACFPRFDSPSIFARLLDRAGGGFHRIAPVAQYLSHHQYINRTNILTTFFEIRPGVALTAIDFMPMGPAESGVGGDPRIVRLLRARGAPIEVSIVADPRPDYGRAPPVWSVDGDLAVVDANGSRVSMSSPWPWKQDHFQGVSTGIVQPNQTVFAQIRMGEFPTNDLTPSSLLTVTQTYWHEWVSPPEAPLRRVAARWQPWVERSELVLKLLSYGDLGSFVAAPTTSLPEWPGGPRNWDYRYVWLRDAAFTTQVFLLLGHIKEARAYLGWAFDRASQVAADEELQPLYTVDGGAPPPEIELPHFEGYRGSRPVRIGNGARGQRQLDIYGEILDAVLILERLDPAFVRDHWATIEHLAQRVVALWGLPDAGMWEERGAPAHHVHSKLMCWVALDRAIQLAQKFGRIENVDRWTRVAEEIRAAILSRGYDDKLGSFVKAFDRPVLDANTLRVGLVGFLPPTDSRVLGTVAAVERVLGQGPFLKRYQDNDGLAGPEGNFLLCSFWLVESLAKSGQRDRALQHWRTLLDVAGPLLLFSEEYDPASNQPLGNYPQAFTHIGVLRAAFALGLMATDE
jgi:alpha,alpha-trehalase